MIWKLFLAAVTVLVQQDGTSAQFTMIPSTTTAAELWNPYTWFWPYAIASAESYRDYFSKAQKATNELYQQIYATNANPFITGNWGGANPAKKPEDNSKPQEKPSSDSKPEEKPNNDNQPEEKPNDNNGGNNNNETPTGDSNGNQTSTNTTTSA